MKIVVMVDGQQKGPFELNTLKIELQGGESVVRVALLAAAA
jgi:hypothetical protein